MNFEEDEFQTVSFRDYIISMIDLDPFYVKIRLEPMKAFLIGNETLLNMVRARAGEKIVIELSEKIEPRKGYVIMMNLSFAC